MKIKHLDTNSQWTENIEKTTRALALYYIVKKLVVKCSIKIKIEEITTSTKTNTKTDPEKIKYT